MKPISQQYQEARAQYQRAKPRSERKVILERRLRDLMTKQLRKEVRGHVARS